MNSLFVIHPYNYRSSSYHGVGAKSRVSAGPVGQP